MKKSVLKLLALLFLSCGLAFAQQPTNNAQVGGVATATGNGTTSTGTQRVTISSDSTGTVSLATGANTIGALTANQSVNAAQINGVTPLMGNGVTGTGSQRVTIASDNTAFSVNATLSAETTKVIGTVRLLGNTGAVVDFAGQNAAAPANALLTGGTFYTAPTTLTNGDASPLQLDSSGKLLVNCTGCTAGSTISLIPATSGGLTMAHLVAAATNNATALKGSAGPLYAASVYNNAAYPVYLKFCNKATACTCGTNTGSDAILFTVAAQAGTEREIHTEQGIAFSTGIGYCVVKGMADTDNTSLAANDAVIDLLSK
jgi:hypothetical protein